MTNIKVIYEDNHVIVVNKPAGLLTQGDKTGDENLLDQVKNYLKETYQKPGNVFLGLVHRLDRPASGLVIFAKTSKGASRLSEQFRNQSVKKIYQVIVSNAPKKEKGTLRNFLIKDEKLKKGREGADGKEAILHYKVLATHKKYAVLEVQIESGQFHQIRTQLSLAGMPILGDVKYKGEAWNNPKAIALCATKLTFKAVVGEDVINLSINAPADWLAYLSD